MNGSDPDHLPTVYSSGYGAANYSGAAVPEPKSRRVDADGRLPFHLNTRTFTSHIFFGPYIYLPIIAGLTWLGGILALLGLWVRDGKPRYTRTEGSVVFISNVAGKHKAVFIPVTAVVAAFWWLALIAERWLRRIDRLPTDKRRREWILGA